jgi:hypothetical protein
MTRRPREAAGFAGLNSVSSAELSALIRFTLAMPQRGKSVFAVMSEQNSRIFSAPRASPGNAVPDVRLFKALGPL